MPPSLGWNERAVFELLNENGLADFYRFGETAGSRVHPLRDEETFTYLDEPTVRGRIVDFTDERTPRARSSRPTLAWRWGSRSAVSRRRVTSSWQRA